LSWLPVYFTKGEKMAEQSYLWEKSYPAEIHWNTPIWTGPIFSYLDQSRRRFPNRPAFNFMGRIWTWEEIGNLTDRMAKGLHDHGVEKGVKVGICLPNTPYYLIAYYAIAKTGATIVNFNPLYAERELAHQIEDSQTDLMVTFDLKIAYDKIEKMLRTTRLNQIVICPFVDILPFPKNFLFSLFRSGEIADVPNDDRHIFISRLTDNDGVFTPPPIDIENDIALLQYTGGTTGIPKGAMLTHANLTANVEQCVSWFQDIHHGQEKMLGVIPFFHVFAMTAIMNFSVKCGFEIVALPRFDLGETLALIDKEKPHFFPAVPAIYNAINNHPKLSTYDLTSLRYCISGGAPLPIEVKKRFEGTTGCILVEGYGLTEASPVVCANPTEGINKPGSIGLPLPSTIVELCEPQSGEPSPLGEAGELCLKGPQVMKGYWNKPEETAKIFRNGFLRTGDVAYMDQEGYVFIVDRIKDLILVNGYNVYPRTIEEAIYLHPAVEECVVAGLPNKDRGEIPKAWIKPKHGRLLTEAEMRDFLKDKLSPIEMPRLIEFRDKPLPKTMIGKISRKEILAEEFSAQER
jgi:long-chain acyl-CoA synthetase